MNELPPLVIEYIKTTPQKLQVIKNHFEILKKEKSKLAFEALRFDIHKLAGSSGSYGFIKVSDRCKIMDDHLKKLIDDFKPSLLSDAFFLEISDFLKKITHDFQKPDLIIEF